MTYLAVVWKIFIRLLIETLLQLSMLIQKYILNSFWITPTDDTHMTSMEIVQFFKPPPTPPLPINVQNSSIPLTLDVQFTRNHSLMITNQLKENIIQGWLLYVIKSFLEVGFRFQYHSFDFFSFSWSLTIYFFVALYSCVCSCPKYQEMPSIYNYSHF